MTIVLSAANAMPLAQIHGTTPRTRLWARLVERDGDRCRYCAVDLVGYPPMFVYGVPLPIAIRLPYPPNLVNIDHLIPRVRGGSNGLDNLGLSCMLCNLRKSDRTEDEFRRDESCARVRDVAGRFARAAL